jgi:HD superfamily phosphohydrolase
MPSWGLEPSQVEATPWGLPSELLAPAKTITDPVHGDVYLTTIERLVVDSPPFQRLRRVRQLGNAHLVYPGATHTRFSHALGALRTAQDLLDAVLAQRHGPHPTPDLFAEWGEGDEKTYARRTGEAIVLARLGALLHDFCHIPYGHTLEDDLRLLIPHDANERRFHELWERIPAPTRTVIGTPLGTALERLVISKNADGTDRSADGYPYPFVLDLVGNTICADLLDYLKRDHLFTGLPAVFGKRFMVGFFVTRSTHPHFPQRMAVRISRGPRPRADVTTELLKFLRYRYELTERVLVHHAKLAADAMLGKLFEMWREALFETEARSIDPLPIVRLGDLDGLRESFANRQGEAAAEDIDRKVRAIIEQELTSRGDDGILEHLADSKAGIGDARRQAVRTLASSVLERRLFKLIGQSFAARPLADRLYKKFRDPAVRRRLEVEAANFAGVTDGWHVVLWIPEPGMKLKAAEVIVSDDRGERPLVNSGAGAASTGRDITELHAALWSVCVFAPQRVKDAVVTRRVILAYLAERLGIAWDDSPRESTVDVAVEVVADDLHLKHDELPRLRDLAGRSIAARGAPAKETFSAICARLKAAWTPDASAPDQPGLFP